MNNFIEDLQSRGIYTFNKSQARKYLKIKEDALSKQLVRYAVKKKILRIKKDFYIILPVEYKNSGILPPFWFIDDLMNHFNISYYVALVSAAANHGAAHQQPQKFQVMVNKSVRDINTKGLHMQFVLKNKIIEKHIADKKTETGYMKISDPNLTVFDMLKYVKKSGGLSNVATIISELLPEINIDEIIDIAKNEQGEVYMRRLGYMLESVINEKDLSDELYSKLKQSNYFSLLDPSKSIKGSEYNKRWQIYINSKIEVDEI
jgi:predicted transcriptional regulator of viral defense system